MRYNLLLIATGCVEEQLMEIIEIMSRKTELEGTMSCQGYEGSPKGHRRYRDCENVFSYKVRIDYRPEE